MSEDSKKESTESEPAEPKAGESEEKTEAAPDVEAIAKRVAALDEGDELERLAREEEAKLAERRAKTRGKKGSLESAASKRLAKIGEKARPAKRAVPAAVEAADPLIDRTRQIGEWARKNKGVVQLLILAAVLGGAGYGVFAYLDRKKAVEASTSLTEAVADERGVLGDPDKAEDENIPHDKVPIFRTAEERREAALKKYREVQTRYHGTGAAWLARLGEGSLLLDKRDPDGALAAFNDVAGSNLAKADAEVRGRALEGSGFAYELKAQLHPEERDKDLDSAIEQYKQLETADVFGFKQMAQYHQARCTEDKGDKTKALELLKALREDLSKDFLEGHATDELKELVNDRLRRLDPTAAPKHRGLGPGNSLSPEMLEKLPPSMRERFMNPGGQP